MSLCMLQSLEKQDEQIAELERIANEKQQELVEASKSIEQHASSMKRVSCKPALTHRP